MSEWSGSSVLRILAAFLLALGLPASAVAAGTVLHVATRHPAAGDGNAGAAESPLKTIGEALRRVRPGQIVRVGAGHYPEELRLTTSGTVTEPIVIESAPGQSATIEGADPLLAWEWLSPVPSNSQTTTRIAFTRLDWFPEMIFIRGRLGNRVDPGAITHPDDFFIEGQAPPFRLCLGVSAPESLASLAVQGSRRRFGFSGEGVSHVVLRGLSVARFQGSGIAFGGGTGNTIEHCLVYHCRLDPESKPAFGISFGAQVDSRIRHCVSVGNSYGIAVSSSSNCLIEANISGAHTVDAFLVTWKSRQITLRRNYAFDNWAERHPDGLQTYRDVSDLTLDGNLFLNVGQGWQCQETQRAIVTNNIWAGIHWGYAISCSLRPSTIGITNLHHVFRHNTVFGGMVLTGGESRFLHNLVVPPALGGCPGGPPLESDFNLLWSDSPHYFRWTKPDGRSGKTTSFKTYQRETGDNPNSLFARPQFRNGPAFYRHLFQSRGGRELTPDKARLHIGDPAGFAVGDWVEVDCDGIPRKITRLADGYATVSPPCDQMPRANLSFLWNWKTNSNFRLDLRLARTGAGWAVGSSVNIQDFQRGDFDGDGLSDVPKLPGPLLQDHPLLHLERLLD